MTTRPSPQEQTDKAVELLEAMAMAWAEKNGIAQQLESIPLGLTEKEEEVRELILRWVINSYMEGLYAGRTSYEQEIARLRAALEGKL